MENSELRIASRTSPLAIFQTNEVINRLKEIHSDWSYSIVPISTKGDKNQSTSLQNIGQTGIFTKALDDAILAGKADIGVHSLKDYPTNIPKGLQLLAVLPRDGYLDVFIPGKIAKSKDEKLTLLSGSPRRRAFWLNKYPKHNFKDLRGNMLTRVNKIFASDGGIVSAPGLERINLLPDNAELLDWMLPAPAQGVIAVIGRDEDSEVEEIVGLINHFQTFACAQIERDFMSAIEAGCAAPLGALCQPHDDGFIFNGALISLDGQNKITLSRLVSYDQWKGAGSVAAQELLNNGGYQLMQEIRALQPKDILCLKEIDEKQRALALEMGLKLHDLEVLNLVPKSFEISYSKIAIIGSYFGAEQLKNNISELPNNLWIVGQKATNLICDFGYTGNIRTFKNSSELLIAFEDEKSDSAVYYGAEHTSQKWAVFGIKHVITYLNRENPPRLARQKWDAILAFSPLGVQSAFRYNDFPKNTPIICIGARTADTAEIMDFERVKIASQPDFMTLLQTLKNELK